MFGKNTNYKVKTPDGWKSFSGILKHINKPTRTIILNNDKNIVCTDDHKIKTTRGFLEARNITREDYVITNDGNYRVLYNEENFNVEDVFDLIDVETNQYYTNDILSHNCEFLGSSHTLIAANKLRILAYTDPENEKEGYRYFDRARKDRTYIMVVDTAHGTGLDYSAFVVFDVTEVPYKVVCTYRNNLIHPIVYPKYIIDAATYYNNCQVLVETNDLGQQVVDIILNELEYDGLISTFARTKKTVATVGFGVKSSVGIRTTRSVKRVGCSTLKSLIESDKLIINDYNILSELSRFALKGTSYEAEDGNDDLVMCCVLFSWFTTQTYFRDLTDTNIVKNIYDENVSMMEEDLTPFGKIETGHDPEYELLDGDLWKVG